MAGLCYTYNAIVRSSKGELYQGEYENGNSAGTGSASSVHDGGRAGRHLFVPPLRHGDRAEQRVRPRLAGHLQIGPWQG